jgi:lipid II:glycine glycyltransferase (peptidoglycan interpeptide bridge formation enzyme)
MKLSFHTINDLGRNMWNELTSTSHYANLFQDYDWAIMNEDNAHEKSIFVIGEEGQDLIGLRLWQRQSLFGPYIETAGGPIYRPGSKRLAIEMIDALMPSLRKKYVYGNILFSPFLSEDFTGLFDGYVPERYTFVVDLTKTEAELWGSLGKSAKWGVRFAERNGITVTAASQYEDWLAFYELQRKETQRKGYAHLALSRRTLDSIYSTLRSKGKCTLLVARHGSKLVAGSLISQSNGVMLWFRNSSEPGLLKLQPNDVLMWNCIMWGKRHGCYYFDLFGAMLYPNGKDSGIYNFKSKWGGKKVLNPNYIIGKPYSYLSRLYRSSHLLRHTLALGRRIYYSRFG